MIGAIPNTTESVNVIVACEHDSSHFVTRRASIAGTTDRTMCTEKRLWYKRDTGEKKTSH